MTSRLLPLLAALSLAAPAAGRSRTAVASYYGAFHHGRLTANGERFNRHGLTCAHRRLPFNTRVRVTYRGRSVVCRVNDRGPYVRGRDIDLSEGAARRLRMVGAGVARVRLQPLGRRARR